MKHTPTPWTFGVGGTGRVLISGEKSRVATTDFSTTMMNSGQLREHNLQNAQFIVRACNAYEAHMGLVEAVKLCFSPAFARVFDNPALAELKQELQAALAKAEGK